MSSADGENFTGGIVVEIDPDSAVIVEESVTAKRMPVAKIVTRLVAAETGVTVKDILSPTRKHSIAHARQLAIYLTRLYTGYSSPQLGGLFGKRDHTTILWAIGRVEGRLRADVRLQGIVDRLQAKIALETGLTPTKVAVTRSISKRVGATRPSGFRLRVVCDDPRLAGVTN